ncbi:MAG: hypothetical protein NTV30_07535 [Chloroflexi bacterium]|nr:hypothetical protein [Chloroflexota bacterium]
MTITYKNYLSRMNKKRVLLCFVVLIALTIALPMFHFKMFLGNPNFGTTPVTLAAVFLPWPFGVIAGLIKGISVSLFTGKYLVEIPAGIGDAIIAFLTYRMVKDWNNSTIAAITGQLFRYIFTSGMVALAITVAIALGIVSTADSPIAGMTSSALTNFTTAWKTISYPAITISILCNAFLSVLIIWLFGKWIRKFLIEPKLQD